MKVFGHQLPLFPSAELCMTLLYFLDVPCNRVLF